VTSGYNNYIRDTTKGEMFMNELMALRLTKKVQGYGVPKMMAKEIVETALQASKGKNVEMYIDYAITLTYGLKVKTNVK
jgi:hypothetical protein